MRIIPPYLDNTSETFVSRSMLVAIVSGQATGAVPIQESNASFVISTFENSGLELKGIFL